MSENDHTDEIRDLQHEVFGPPRNPERGLTKRTEKLEQVHETEVRPIVNLYKGAKWPLGVAFSALLLLGVNWFVGVAQKIGELLP